MVVVHRTDTQPKLGPEAPPLRTAVLAATVVFVVIFAVSACFLDWIASLGLAVWMAVFSGIINMEGTRA